MSKHYKATEGKDMVVMLVFVTPVLWIRMKLFEQPELNWDKLFKGF